jgi:membrane protein YdbS with pleckstrin-like domain
MTFVVSAGDYFVHPQVFRAGDHTWQRRYDVLAAEHGTRFGRADVLLNVRISCVDTQSGSARVIDVDRKMWLSQVVQAL